MSANIILPQLMAPHSQQPHYLTSSNATAWPLLPPQLSMEHPISSPSQFTQPPKTSSNNSNVPKTSNQNCRNSTLTNLSKASRNGWRKHPPHCPANILVYISHCWKTSTEKSQRCQQQLTILHRHQCKTLRSLHHDNGIPSPTIGSSAHPHASMMVHNLEPIPGKRPWSTTNKLPQSNTPPQSQPQPIMEMLLCQRILQNCRRSQCHHWQPGWLPERL